MKKLKIKEDIEAIELGLNRCPEVHEIVKQLFVLFESKGLSPNFKDIKRFLVGYWHQKETHNSDLENERKVSNFLKSLIADTHHEKTTDVLGFKLNKEKFSELLDLDKNLVTDIIDLISKTERQDGVYLDFIEYDKESKQITLNNSFKEHIKEKHTMYAHGDKQIEVANMLLSLINSMNEYERITGYKIHREEPFKGIQWRNGKGEISMDFLERYSLS
jgi:hypothetical protein